MTVIHYDQCTERSALTDFKSMVKYYTNRPDEPVTSTH